MRNYAQRRRELSVARYPGSVVVQSRYTDGRRQAVASLCLVRRSMTVPERMHYSLAKVLNPGAAVRQERFSVLTESPKS